jgi:hypothetical protein
VACTISGFLVTASSFVPTHVVPDGGLAAYERPDPSAPSVAHVEARVEVSVPERLGDWARIVCSNGWAGWVDGRLLVSRPLTSSSAATGGLRRAAPGRAGALALSPALAGCGLIALGTILPWIRGQGGGNGFDAPLALLWSAPSSTRPGAIDLWIPLFGLAGLGVAGCLDPVARTTWRRVGGAGAAAVSLLYVVWLWRFVSAPGVDVSLTSVLGVGPLVILGGGALLALGKASR